MQKIVVLHGSYGCDTGCCGHFVEVDGRRVGDFSFGHPYDGDHLEFAKKLVAEEYGEEHVADLDWENCMIVDD
jgi:hypothetical protein